MWRHCYDHIDDLMQKRRNTIALALELRLLCNNPYIYIWQIILADENWAFIIEESYYIMLASKGMGDKSCEYVRADKTFLPLSFSFALPKGSEELEVVSLR